MNDVTVTRTPTVPQEAGARPRARTPWRALSAWGAGLLLAGVSLVVAHRAFDADGITPVPQLLAFLPALLVPGGLALILAALARWRAGLVWAVLALAVTGWFLVPYGDGDAGARGPELARLTVLTSNVKYGAATEQLITTVESTEPDLVFVQECDLTCADALDAKVPAADYPHREMVRASGAEGSAILSRYPLSRADGVAGQLAMPGAEAVVEGRRVRLQLAHPLPPTPAYVRVWGEELDRLRDYAAGGGDQPTIVAGDFNATQDHAAFRRILDAGLRDSARVRGDSRDFTWPADRVVPLGVQIDHVLVSEEFSVRSVRFVDLEGTDHRSLLVRLALHEEKKEAR